MYKFFIAFRYMISRPISLVSIIGIFLSVGALIVIISVMSGFLRETKAFIRGTMSDFVVTPIRSMHRVGDEVVYKEAPSFETLRSAIKSVTGVSGVAPRFVRPALVTRSDGIDPYKNSSKFSDMNFTKALGIDPEYESEVSRIKMFLTELDLPSHCVDRVDDPFYISKKWKSPMLYSRDYPSILMGEDKFVRLGLEKGAVVTLATLDTKTLKDSLDKGSDIKPFEQKFFVAGAFRSGNHQFDMEFVIIDMQAAWDWVGCENEVSEIYVACKEGAYDARGPEIQAGISNALMGKGLDAIVESWEERNAIFLGAVENERTILGVILAFFIIIATFNVYATISMMVTDKTKDIGILVSMGATSFGIMGTFVVCGLFMWLIGSLLGAVAGFFFADNINAIKDFIENTFGIQVFNKNVYNFREIPVEISPTFIGIIIACTFMICFLFSLLPALRASWMDPVKALRHE